MRTTLRSLSVQPSGWSLCHTIGRRKPVMAWGVFAEVGQRVTVGMVVRGQALMRGDRLQGFEGYAAGPGCEPQLDPPALPPADLNDAMASALAVNAESWQEYEARIRSALASAANIEWATVSLAGFEADPSRWFRLWLQGRREREQAEQDLMLRLRALSLLAPGRSLADALAVTASTLGGLLATPDNTQGGGLIPVNQHASPARKAGSRGESS